MSAKFSFIEFGKVFGVVSSAILCILCQQASSHKVLLMSFDGFRWDYLEKFQDQTPNFHKIIKNGVFARNGIKSMFETLTVPNHMTLVTGLYSESHGLSSNVMYDPVLKKSFLPAWIQGDHDEDHFFLQSAGEPIWVTNQVQNTDARSGSIMWVGGRLPVKSVQPTYHVDYDDGIPFKERIDIVVKWFTQEQPINLGLVYFPEPDITAHETGIDSDQMKAIITHIDKTIGYLFEKLGENNLLDDMNIIITADHGFAVTPISKVIMMDDIVPPHWYERTLSRSPLFNVIPKPGMADTIYEKLKEAADKPDSHFKVYKKEDIPDRFHYKHNIRVQPVIALADLEYSFLVNETIDQLYCKSQSNDATHGYDNDYKEMNAFFVAAGPSFKKGFSVDTFNIVDVYPLMCNLLDLKPAPNNGSMQIVSLLLVENETTTKMWTLAAYTLVLIVILILGGVFIAFVCRHRRHVKRKAAYTRPPPLAEARSSTPEIRNGQHHVTSLDEKEEAKMIKISA